MHVYNIVKRQSRSLMVPSASPFWRKRKLPLAFLQALRANAQGVADPPLAPSEPEGDRTVWVVVPARLKREGTRDP